MKWKTQYEKYKHDCIALTKTWNEHKEGKNKGSQSRKGKTFISHGLDFLDDQGFKLN